jgi:hypothetical protein
MLSINDDIPYRCSSSHGSECSDVNSSTVQCYYCRKSGHYAVNCPKKLHRKICDLLEEKYRGKWEEIIKRKRIPYGFVTACFNGNLVLLNLFKKYNKTRALYNQKVDKEIEQLLDNEDQKYMESFESIDLDKIKSTSHEIYVKNISKTVNNMMIGKAVSKIDKILEAENDGLINEEEKKICLTQTVNEISEISNTTTDVIKQTKPQNVNFENDGKCQKLTAKNEKKIDINERKKEKEEMKSIENISRIEKEAGQPLLSPNKERNPPKSTGYMDEKEAQKVQFVSDLYYWLSAELIDSYINDLKIDDKRKRSVMVDSDLFDEEVTQYLINDKWVEKKGKPNWQNYFKDESDYPESDIIKMVKMKFEGDDYDYVMNVLKENEFITGKKKKISLRNRNYNNREKTKYDYKIKRDDRYQERMYRYEKQKYPNYKSDYGDS